MLSPVEPIVRVIRADGANRKCPLVRYFLFVGAALLTLLLLSMRICRNCRQRADKCSGQPFRDTDSLRSEVAGARCLRYHSSPHRFPRRRGDGGECPGAGQRRRSPAKVRVREAFAQLRPLRFKSAPAGRSRGSRSRSCRRKHKTVGEGQHRGRQTILVRSATGFARQRHLVSRLFRQSGTFG